MVMRFERCPRSSPPCVPLLARTSTVWCTWWRRRAGPSATPSSPGDTASSPGGRDALIDEIYVRDRGSGVGTSLLAAILDDLKGERALPRLTLETEKANEAARRFYARHGFVAEDSVWMSLDLP